MVTLEQIRELEQRVGRAVEVIRLLRDENRTLRGTLDRAQERMRELEELMNAFKNDQAAIEEGIRSAIGKLDELEDEVTEARPQTEGEESTPDGREEAEAVSAAAADEVPVEDERDPEAVSEPGDHGKPPGEKRIAEEEEQDDEEEHDRELDIF